MARYVFLLFDTEDWFDADEQTQAELFRLHDEFGAAVAEAGASIAGGEGLERTTTATTVDRTGDRPLLTDGPFVDIKEALGGFYVIDAPDLDVALDLARRCPAAHVEVRPVLAVPDDVAG